MGKHLSELSQIRVNFEKKMLTVGVAINIQKTKKKKKLNVWEAYTFQIIKKKNQ